MYGLVAGFSIRMRKRAANARKGTVEGATQDASSATLEDDIPTGEFPRVDDTSIKASLVEVIDTPPLQARQARFLVYGARRPPNRLVHSSYVEPMEWARPTEDALTLNQVTAWELTNY